MQTLTCEQVREIDRRAIDDFGMTSLVLMENAGRGCADLLCRLGIAGKVVIACGKGNNGGDGFVIARHLDLRGYEVEVQLWTHWEELQGDAADNFAILQKANIPISTCWLEPPAREIEKSLGEADWVVDALVGTGAKGSPRPPYDAAIKLLNASPAKKLAVDLPSGLDAKTGKPNEPTFLADHTATFVAAKTGMLLPCAQGCIGQLHVLDIGAPRKLLADYSLRC